MARQQRLVCTSCENKIPAQTFCPNCGVPTVLCSAQERIVWEMGQWESSRGSSSSKSSTIKREPAPSFAPSAASPVTREPSPHPAIAAQQRPARPMTTSQIMAPAGTLSPGAQRPAATQASAASSGMQTEGSAALATMVEIEPIDLHEPADAEPQPRRSTSVVPRPARPALSREQAADAAQAVAREAAEATRIANEAAAKQSPSSVIAASVIKARRPRAQAPEAVVEAPIVQAPVVEEAPAAPSRKEQKQARKQAEAAERAEAEHAKAAAKEQAKAAKEQAKASKEQANLAKAQAKAAPKQQAEPGARLSRRERRIERMGRALELVPGETITLALDGRSGVARATLLVTRYRVAVVFRPKHMRARWIPLEEVSQLSTAWRGAPTIHADATVEHLTFSRRSKTKMAEVAALLEGEVGLARSPGAQRHDASITQLWCDTATQTWDDSFGRIRLWIRRHPVFTVSWLFAALVVAVMASTHSLR